MCLQESLLGEHPEMLATLTAAIHRHMDRAGLTNTCHESLEACRVQTSSSGNSCKAKQKPRQTHAPAPWELSRPGKRKGRNRMGIKNPAGCQTQTNGAPCLSFGCQPPSSTGPDLIGRVGPHAAWLYSMVPGDSILLAVRLADFSKVAFEAMDRNQQEDWCVAYTSLT
jgi:hypothetical protein